MGQGGDRETIEGREGEEISQDISQKKETVPGKRQRGNRSENEMDRQRVEEEEWPAKQLLTANPSIRRDI